jgi:2-C-methyl-D-erythritol 4-phosphate cytidylyltransferase / 2-C-methyl-D-erythritol 2,4-cyclodiphosphate synthase
MKSRVSADAMNASHKKPKVFVIIVAAGRGNRFGGNLPKQYAPLLGQTILRRTTDFFLNHPGVNHVVPVIHADDHALFEISIAGVNSSKLASACIGGATRQASVLAGLTSIVKDHQNTDDIVLIHDAARPFVSDQLISRAISAGQQFGAAVPGADVTDTIVGIENDSISTTPDRASLKAVQTPQAFRLDLILAAHEKAAAAKNQTFTDDGSIARFAGHKVHVFQGDPQNMKITTQDDLVQATQKLNAFLISRTASGYDVHAFGEGDHVWLCGLKIPHNAGFIAHSDGDVALHALTDALLGAMADGDIGRHFPPSENRWKGASSDQFLRFAADRLRARGGILDCLDVTLICEAPKIGPHADAMRQRVSEIVDIPVSNISVKATTTERLGFTGRKEGIAALASATIRLPQ